jgi:hypothetical protein
MDIFEVSRLEPRHKDIAVRAGLWDQVEEMLGRPLPEYRAQEGMPGCCRWCGTRLGWAMPPILADYLGAEVRPKGTRGPKPKYCPAPDDPDETSCETKWRSRDKKQRRDHEKDVELEHHVRIVSVLNFLNAELIKVIEAIEPAAAVLADA